MRKPLRKRKGRIILSEQTGTSSEAPQSSEILGENASADVREEIISAQYSGPLLLPSRFREYNNVLPGSAERILKMAENEQNGRREWDKAALDGALKENARGQYLGAGLSVIFAVVAVILALLERELAASAFAVACAASGIYHFKSWKPK